MCSWSSADTWLDWIGQRQLLDETRIKFCDLVRLILDIHGSLQWFRSSAVIYVRVICSVCQFHFHTLSHEISPLFVLVKGHEMYLLTYLIYVYFPVVWRNINFPIYHCHHSCVMSFDYVSNLCNGVASQLSPNKMQSDSMSFTLHQYT